MAEQFLSTSALRDALADASFDRPPAIVSNAHITGLSVARALDAHDVPVIALDRNGDGVAPPSNAVEFAGTVTYPLEDFEGFQTDVEAIVEAVGRDVVPFGCMDEWAHAYARVDGDGVRLPFADAAVVDSVLNKSELYATCERLDVPYPETHRLSEVSIDEAADALGFPLVVKPALKREFEEAFGTNVIEVADREEFADVVTAAENEGIDVMAQKRVDVAAGEDRSLASYVPPAGVEDAIGVVGNARVRYPRQFGTSCLVERVDHPAIEERALGVLEETGYYGISESEFVYDADREEYLLLDVNTRPWKWIGMPVAAGVNLPMAAYAAVTDAGYEAAEPRDSRWVYLRDYLSLLAGEDAFWDVLSADDWAALLSGSFETAADTDLTTGVYRPTDPAPAAKLIETEFTDREYYCAC
ncbi:carboxylate--amine ligase [haloarchaeon 3A1-DGR]|nr:carboxylate--amine ligase [haloarchaeon 3A1-DGR]